jgi:prepilin-type N-terminal cleavage/methylation domain-containing protein
VTSALRRLRGERGYTLVEMLTVVSILSVILTGLTTLFIQGSNAQMDMNRRFEAQQSSRVALDKLRREIHCAQAASTSPGAGAATTVTLDLPSQCPTAVGGAQTDVSWCTVGSGTKYALHRKVGATCDATGVKWAESITTANVFDYQTQSVDQLARLRVELPVDVKTGDATPAYALCDVMVLRNSSRVAPTASIRGYTDTAALTSC